MSGAGPSGDARLILLPGLGADERLFGPQREAFGERLLVPAWPSMDDAAGAFDVTEIGRRLAAQLAGDGSLDGAPFVLGGVSFGGQVALEAARVLAAEGRKATAVVLIAGCRSHESIPGSFKVARRVGRWVPGPVARAIIGGPLAGVFIRRHRLAGADAEAIRSMAKELDRPRLLRFARACARWRFDPEAFTAETGVPIRQIHGRKDPVIPMRAGDPDHVIEDGLHLIHMTHADEVNGYLRDVMDAESADG
ncbi:MAG: alpha/beta hydrolase [Planctomycetota bacterium]